MRHSEEGKFFVFSTLVTSKSSQVRRRGLGQCANLPKQILCRLRCNPLVERNCSLDGTLVLHGLETLRPLLQLERLVDDALDLDLTAICS